MMKNNPDGHAGNHNKPNIEEKKKYTKPALVALGPLQRLTLGGSNITSNDSQTGHPPGPRT